MKMQPKKIRWRTTLISGIGAILAAFGAALAICWDDVFHSIIANGLTLTATSRSYEGWREPPVTLYFDVYLFNWTNPEDFLYNVTKPNFVEVGPYRFRETREKVNITWNPDNSTVSYKILKRWYFDEEGSNGTLEDSVTTLNVLAASAVYTSRFWSYMRQKSVSLGLTMFHQPIAITKTAGELMFEGYEDSLLDMAKTFPQKDVTAPLVDRFGWFFERNGSVNNDGYYNVATGEKNFSIFGQVLRWNNVNQTQYYPGECGKVQGSASEFYPSKMSKSKKLILFSPDLCRNIAFEFEDEVIINGIPGYKYSGDTYMLDNGTLFEENKCFCVGECQPSGAMNVSTCRFGSPAFLSFPHFYGADPYYKNALDGLTPNEEKHKFYVTIEPTSGIPIDVAARFQLNILVAPNKNVALYSKVPKIFLPMLWFEQRYTLGDKQLDDIKLLLKVPLIGHIVSLTIFVVGIVCILWTPITVNIKACRKSRRTKRGKAVEEGNREVLNNLRNSEEMKNLKSQDKDEVEDKDDDVIEPLTKVNDLTKE